MSRPEPNNMSYQQNRGNYVQAQPIQHNNGGWNQQQQQQRGGGIDMPNLQALGINPQGQNPTNQGQNINNPLGKYGIQNSSLTVFDFAIGLVLKSIRNKIKLKIKVNLNFLHYCASYTLLSIRTLVLFKNSQYICRCWPEFECSSNESCTSCSSTKSMEFDRQLTESTGSGWFRWIGWSTKSPGGNITTNWWIPFLDVTRC